MSERSRRALIGSDRKCLFRNHYWLNALRGERLIESAKVNGVNPNANPLEVLTKLPTAKHGDLDALMPWNFGR